jgi:Zn-dependent protease
LYGIYIERDEAIQIVISVLAISFALSLVFAGVNGALAYPKEFLFFIAPVLVTVGSGFILHEMAHKLVALFYGAQARFRMWTQGLVFMLVTSLFGFLFAAPGAVYIYSNNIKPRENGIISLVGPMVNVTLVFVFLGLNVLAPINQYYSFLYPSPAGLEGFGIANGLLLVWKFGAAMNLILAMFNMLPAFPLDGSKVYMWNRGIWFLVVIGVLLLGSVIISPSIVITFGIMLIFFTILSKLLFG